MVRIHYFAVMVTVMQFSQFFLMDLLQKKKEHKSADDSFIAILIPSYDLKYINSTTKKRFSNKN